jgi:16S rRNA (guanine527-N7)-methyltransferase
VSRTDELASLREGARCFDLTLEASQAEALLLLVDELERANTEFNLTAIRDRPAMLVKHVLDSLSVHPHLRGARIADVGTGAGFPGLPLAIVNPERRFTLIEATGKKARYARQTAERLKLANVEVANTRAELYRPAASFDSVAARALSSLTDFVRYAGHLCAPDGRLLAMKGKRPDQEIAALPASFRVAAVHRIALPGLDDERHLVELSPAGLKSPAKPKPNTT